MENQPWTSHEQVLAKLAGYLLFIVISGHLFKTKFKKDSLGLLPSIKEMTRGIIQQMLGQTNSYFS